MSGFASIRRKPPPPQLGRRLHRQRKGRQRARAVVNLHPRQVVRQDQRGDLGRVIALFLVDGVEQVKGIGQHVPRPGGGIADADVFGAGDAQEIRLGLFRRDVVVHLLGQTALGPVQQPEPPQRVLHQVADDPVRGEELRRGGDVLGRDLLVLLEAREDLILLLRDVELVEPADDLDVLTGVLGHDLAQSQQDGGCDSRSSGISSSV